MTVTHLVPTARAVLDGDALVIHALLVTDPDVVRSAGAFVARTGIDDVSEHVLGLLELGAKAAALGGATVDVDQIKQCLTTFTSEVSSTARESVSEIRMAVTSATDAETGSIAKAVTAAMDELAREVTHVVSGEDAPLRQSVERTVKSVTDKALGEVQRALAGQGETLRSVLSADSPTSPINALKAELMRTEHQTRQEVMRGLEELRTMIEVAKTQKRMLEKSAAKGLDFEDRLVAAVTELGHGAGDTVCPTGTTVGELPRCKTGDAVVTLARATTRRHTVRMVVEAKDTTLTADRWRLELDNARKNRDATAAVGVARSTDLMPGGRRILILDPLNVVVAHDPATDAPDVLYAAYHLVRAQAACVVLDGEDGLDVNSLRQHLEAALGSTQDLDKIERSAGSARRCLDEVSKTAERVQAQLLERLHQSLRLLDNSGAGSASKTAV